MDTETIDLMIESTKDFYKELQEDVNGRYRSWEHCYYNFYHARKNKNADVDYLSLQLAFYLASWGMYRGSSFLLQKDYKIHIPVVEEILKEEYSPLMGIKCEALKKEQNQKLLIKFYDRLSELYDKVRENVYKNLEKEVKSNLSPILITKVLMGTIGCVPAYDRFFIAGIKNQKVATGNYNIKSILQLVNFYEENEAQLEDVRALMKVCSHLPAPHLEYPQMKLLDMGFWKIGYNLDNNKAAKLN